MMTVVIIFAFCDIENRKVGGFAKNISINSSI